MSDAYYFASLQVVQIEHIFINVLFIVLIWGIFIRFIRDPEK